MKTTVFLIRHGEISNPNKIIYGRNIDLKLSEKGKNQVSLLAEKLKYFGYKVDKIYSSPLLRAVQTSEILRKVLRVRIIEVEVGFTDDDMPDLAGKPLTVLSMFSLTGMDQYSKKYMKLGNESRSHVIRRVKKAFFQTLKENKGKSIAIVTHGNPICFLLFNLLNRGKKIPSMNVLMKRGYPKKGSAVRLVIESGKVLEKEYIY